MRNTMTSFKSIELRNNLFLQIMGKQQVVLRDFWEQTDRQTETETETEIDR